MSRRRDLIVPIHDRRKRKRYLTLKNVGIALLACFVAFAAISIRSELRGLRPGDYSGLYERELPSPAPEPKPVDAVREAPASAVVAEHPGAGTVAEPVDPAPVAIATDIASASVPRGEVAIVGGPEGVAIVRQEQRRPTLSGGFGRP